MTKESKRTLILTTLVCLVPIIAGAVLYSRLPEQIVTHWDAAGNPNGWSSRFTGVFILPGSMLLANLLFPFILKIDPKNQNIPVKIRTLVQWIIPAVSLFASGITLVSAVGSEVKVSLIMPMFIGFLFIFIGNYMPKMSQSYTVGIRVPWTLDDEEIWDKTHRFAGFLWVICGILTVIGAFFPCRMVIFVVLLALMVFVPIIYSYVLYLKKKQH